MIILKNKRILFTTSNVGAVTYAFTSDSPCVAFEVVSETYSNTTQETELEIVYNVHFTDEECLENATLTFTATDVTGCESKSTIPIDNICEDFLISGTSISDPFTFSVTVAGGSGQYTYQWDFDSTLFSPDDPDTNNNVLTLEYTGSQPTPQTTLVAVRVLDSEGCEATTQFNYHFCSPIASDTFVTLQCVPDTPATFQNCTGVYRASQRKVLPVETCTGHTIDWTTLDVTVPANFCWYTITTAGNTYFYLNANLIPAAGNYVFPYQVKDSQGNVSNTANLHVTVTTCDVEPTIVIPNQHFTIPCSAVPTDTFSILLDDKVFITDSVIDWTTWNLDVAPASGASVTLRQDAFGSYWIDYVIPAGTDPDTFTWHVCDVDGNCSNTTYYTILLVCEDTPSLVADNDCSICGTPRTINVLSNDTANAPSFVVSSVQIVDPPDFGTASVNGDGTITYTPNAGYTGPDTFTYKVRNSNGIYGSPATVTIDVVCAGLSTEITVC